LCTYADQFFDIRQRLDQSFGGDRSHGIRVANVDNYQGEECDIIILSLVRSNNPQNRIGFLNVRELHLYYLFYFKNKINYVKNIIK
jgi:superfamily I DNA and/or RNA helicase